MRACVRACVRACARACVRKYAEKISVMRFMKHLHRCHMTCHTKTPLFLDAADTREGAVQFLVGYVMAPSHVLSFL